MDNQYDGTTKLSDWWKIVKSNTAELLNLITTHAAKKDNPHGVTKADVGLGNVDNTSDKQKPVSDKTQAELDKKVNVETGKQLMTAEESAKLSGIADNANNYVHPGSHPASMITQDSTHRFVTDDEKLAWNNSGGSGTGGVGMMGAGEKSNILNDVPSDTERPHNTATGQYALAEGFQTNAGGNYSHAEGSSTNAGGICAHVGGSVSSATGNYSFVHGQQSSASKLCAAAIGFHVNSTLDYMMSVGRYNKQTANTLFVVGNGTSNADANAFRVATDGNVYGAGAYNSTGADYAEMFEWLDGNPKGEDRRGLLVTLDGDKIRPATQEDDYVLGVVSANPGMVGNNYGDQWQGMYVTNLWGDVVVDDNGDPVISEDYDDSLEYVPREMRKEWGMVGLMGQLIVIDDGTCTVNGYCKPSMGGKATTALSGYRVMKRMDDTHILVMVR